MILRLNENKISALIIILKCIFIVLLYTIGHVYYSPLLYIAIIATFSLFIINYKDIFALSMFFIPIASIMKLQSSGMTVLNLAILCSLAILWFNNKDRVVLTEILIGISLIILLLYSNRFIIIVNSTMFHCFKEQKSLCGFR